MPSEAPYIIITPVKNEETFIAGTAECVLEQTARPMAWVIVDDGSTDATARIAGEYEARHGWIKVARLPGSERTRGGHIVELFYRGLACVDKPGFEFLVKLDSDLTFEPDFFERALDHMKKNPALGITSGISRIMRGGRLIEERSASGHTLGACKVYRRRCFDEIGGLVRAMGWDGVDEIKARMKGWEAAPVPGLSLVHMRPEGRAMGSYRSGVERGRGSYYMGYHPAFLAARAARSLLRSPLDSAGMLSGYFGALLKGGERIDDPELIKQLRESQARRLFPWGRA